jgi:hypothetical protein
VPRLFSAGQMCSPVFSSVLGERDAITNGEFGRSESTFVGTWNHVLSLDKPAVRNEGE